MPSAEGARIVHWATVETNECCNFGRNDRGENHRGFIDVGKPMAYMYPMRTAPMTVIETPSFLRDAKRLMNEEERQKIVAFLAQNPDAGDILQGTGGIRKVRFAREGGGKSGGYRVIYFFHSQDIPLFALNVFAKNEKANISPAERNAMRELSALLVATYKRGVL